MDELMLLEQLHDDRAKQEMKAMPLFEEVGDAAFDFGGMFAKGVIHKQSATAVNAVLVAEAALPNSFLAGKLRVDFICKRQGQHCHGSGNVGKETYFLRRASPCLCS